MTDHGLPDLNEHLDHIAGDLDRSQLHTAVYALLGLGTCFAVIGGEHEIRTTERGARRLSEIFGWEMP